MRKGAGGALGMVTGVIGAIHLNTLLLPRHCRRKLRLNEEGNDESRPPVTTNVMTLR